MKKNHILALCLMMSLFSLSCLKEDENIALDGMSLEGFTSLFDGQSLGGWQRLADGQGEGGLWIVADKTIVGEQGPNREGGILITETLYSHYEVYMEIKADYPIDSGLFLRI